MVNWVFGQAMFRALGPDGERTPTALNLVRAAVVVNLVVLGYFKYYDFFVDAFTDSTDAIGLGLNPPLLEILLPVGHLVLHLPRHQLRDRHRPGRRSARCRWATSRSTSRSSPTSSPGRSCGPASSPRRSAAGPTPATIPAAEAFRLIVAGLFKKVVVSSYLATELVDPVFGAPERPRLSWDLLLARLRLRHPDLRRLLRLHRHRHRLRPAARLPVPPELRRARTGRCRSRTSGAAGT